ncbi:MAG TPA: thioredoxin-like domain-containing protein [Pirellulaceae bacterium]|nr:thioredoxin-like domain-containing protein [Pirellulaceae bacterium]
MAAFAGCQRYEGGSAVAVAQVTEPAAADEDSSGGAAPAAKEAAATKASGDDAGSKPAPAKEASPAEPKEASDPEDDRSNVVAPPKVRQAAEPPVAGPLKPANPFQKRYDMPDFPKDLDWINSKPLTMGKLKGKFVILDFWTFCCINCLHILPELKKLEKKYPNELVVIGVHSAKFENEKITENILSAVLRHEIEHPVVNDADHVMWDTLGISSWPTILLIDPEGKAVWGRSGEFKAPEVDEVLKAAIPYYRSQKLLDEKPFPLELASESQAKTPLRFPGKLLADETGSRLFISDSNHNRIVITTLEGKLLEIIGSGKMGRADGDYQTATFDHPQGMALLKETLYVADTENHLLRKVDLKAKKVSTIAGIGVQGRHPWPGLNEFGLDDDVPARFVGKPETTAINSPWDLWVHDGDLYIAMAGPHQIWKMTLDESEIGPYAGNGREDIVDGPLLPRQPYAQGYSSFAQPSGLTSDGTWLYVADSEGSSIRAVPFDATQEVKTVLGTAGLPFARLFTFGDADGPPEKAKLQHCLGVAYADGQIYVVDTYNNKVKMVDAKTGHTKTLAGNGSAGSDDEAGTFDEPAGISYAKGKLYVADTNNHLIRTIDLATKKVATLNIAGLTPPAAPKADTKPTFKGAIQEKVALATLKPIDAQIKLEVSLEVPAGWKINPLAPMSYWVDAAQGNGPVDRTKLGKRKLDKPVAQFEVAIPVAGNGTDELTVSLNYYYCQEGDDGVCKTGSVVYTVPVKIAGAGKESVTLVHKIAE